MIILAHRGWWTAPEEKNTYSAFKRALQAGYGLELDLRDQAGEIVVCHDPPVGSTLPFSALLALYDETGRPGPLALNVKSDGLQPILQTMLAPLRPQDFFLFDMSIPDTLGYLRRGLRVFTRQSEYEPEIAFASQAAGVWLDVFESEWFGPDLVRDHLSCGRQVALVSPELHRRPHRDAWTNWRELPRDDVMLCTDFPQEAEDFYNGGRGSPL
jgi:glycerophosphoryl diester phosphodiesterase